MNVSIGCLKCFYCTRIFVHNSLCSCKTDAGEFEVKGKKLYFGFVDLEKAFDRVPREVIKWAMRKLGVENGWYR